MAESFSHHGFNFQGSGEMSNIDASSTLCHVGLDLDISNLKMCFHFFCSYNVQYSFDDITKQRIS